VKVGGLAPASTHLAEQLARRHEVHFFTRGTGRGAFMDGVRYHYCQPRGANIVDYCRNMGVLLLDVFRQEDYSPFDILHFHDWHFVEIMHLLRGRNTVLSYHSTEYGRNGSNFGDWWEFREISGKEWYGGYIAERVITVSNHTKTEIMWLYNIPEWKITVAPNGIYPERYRSLVDPAAVKRLYGIDPSAPLVLFVGRLVYQKGPDLLVRAVPLVLKKQPNARFVVIGDGSMRATLEAEAAALPVQFLGFVDDAKHLELLNSCDLVVIPSRNEPFGLVLTEAWSAGRCVVATDVGGLSENIENFVDGLKVPVREESIAWAIAHALEDPAMCCRFGAAGRTKVESTFDWGSIAGQVERVYRSLVGGGEG
jgi:glycosyltransferase involved in cell wall biosynthesis